MSYHRNADFIKKTWKQKKVRMFDFDHGECQDELPGSLDLKIIFFEIVVGASPGARSWPWAQQSRKLARAWKARSWDPARLQKAGCLYYNSQPG